MQEPMQGARKHKLMPAEVRKAIPPLYSQDGKGENAIVHVKFFSPYSGYTAYCTEFDGEDTLFGWADCGGGGEFGYISLQELATAAGMRGRLPLIERDRGFSGMTVAQAIEGRR